MFDLDQLRSAALASSPWEAFRTLVNEALAQGSAKSQARQALLEFDQIGMIDEELSTLGYEAFRDTIDNLAGMCSEEFKFHEFSDQTHSCDGAVSVEPALASEIH